MFALHFFAALYLHRTSISTFFKFTKEVSLLIACSCMAIYSFEIIYTGLALSSMLVFPLFYFSLCLIEKKRKYCIPFYTIPYILSFTTGYATISIVLVGIVFLTTLVYIYNFVDKNKKARAFMHLFFVVFISGFVCLLYYWNTLSYTSKIVNTTGNNLAQV